MCVFLFSYIIYGVRLCGSWVVSILFIGLLIILIFWYDLLSYRLLFFNEEKLKKKLVLKFE